MSIQTFEQTPLVKTKYQSKWWLYLLSGFLILLLLKYSVRIPFLKEYFAVTTSGHQGKSAVFFVMLPFIGPVLMGIGAYFLNKYYYIQKIQRSYLNTITHGFSEIEGKIKLTQTFLSPSKKECAWFRLIIETYHKGWNTYASFEPKDFSLHINDGTGVIELNHDAMKYLEEESMDSNIIDSISGIVKHPDLAFINPKIKSRWRARELILQANDPMYALGYVERPISNHILRKKGLSPCVVSFGDSQKISSIEFRNGMLLFVIGLIFFGIFIAALQNLK